MLYVKYVIKAGECMYSFDIKIKCGSATAANLGLYPLVLIQVISSALDAAHKWQCLHGAGAKIGTKQWMSPNKEMGHPRRTGALQAEAERRHPR